jgi:hypothetical protein
MVSLQTYPGAGRLIASSVWVALLKCILYRRPVPSDRGSIVRRIDFPTLKQGHNSIAKDLPVALRQSDTSTNSYFAFHGAASLGWRCRGVGVETFERREGCLARFIQEDEP